MLMANPFQRGDNHETMKIGLIFKNSSFYEPLHQKCNIYIKASTGSP